MASIRKTERDEMVAYAKHTQAASDAIVMAINLRAVGHSDDVIDAHPDVLRLRQRAGAFHAVWLKKARELEALDERVGQ